MYEAFHDGFSLGLWFSQPIRNKTLMRSSFNCEPQMQLGRVLEYETEGGLFVFKLITFFLDLSNAETTSLYAQKVFEHTRA